MPKKKGGKTPKRKGGKLTKGQKAQVNKMIVRHEEVKQYTYSAVRNLYSPAQDFNNFYSTSGDLLVLSPHSSSCAIAQGTTDATRVGNAITTQKCILNLAIYPNAYNATYNATPQPGYIKLWFFKIKYASDITDVQSIIFNNFLDSNASSNGLTGALGDITAKVNTNVISLLKTKVVKLGCANYYGTGATAGQQYFDNNDFKIAQNISIDCTSMLLKEYTFNDNNTIPYNPATFCLVEWIPFNNDTTNGGARPASMYFSIQYMYTDA